MLREAQPGTLDQVIRDGALTLRATMNTPYVEHAYLEPEAGYATWHGAALAAGASSGTYARGVEIFLRNLEGYLSVQVLVNEASIAK